MAVFQRDISQSFFWWIIVWRIENRSLPERVADPGKNPELQWFDVDKVIAADRVQVLL